MKIRNVLLGILISLSSVCANECGKTTRNSGFIVFGNQFKHGDFPWIVALKYTKNNPPTFFCGGTLVSSHHVITAAHCIKPKYGEGGDITELVPRDILALFGAYDLSNANEVGRITLSPEAVHIHEDWNPQVRSYDADIAVLKFTEGEISMKLTIQPICIWKSPSLPPATEGTVAGWGRSENETKIHENIPKKLTIPMRSNDDCFLKTPGLAGISSKRTFCAGLETGSGVCLGDSGNGFFIESGGSVYLRGIVSSSRTTATTCDVTKYAVYTDVLKFSDWITSIIGDGGSDMVVTETRLISCSLQNIHSDLLGKTARTCVIQNQAAESVNTVIEGDRNSDVQVFQIENNKNVKFIPTNIYEKFRQLTMVKIVGTAIESIDQHFVNFEKLKILDLPTNQLKTISANAFRDLIDLTYLGLSENKIEVLPATLFSEMENLEDLFMSANRLKSLDEGLLKSLTKLKSFWVNNNQIKEIPGTLFSKNLMLESILFTGNEIETLHDDTFKNLRELKSLSLTSNRIKVLSGALLRSLHNLGDFDIFDNRIRRLDPNVFDSLTNMWSLNIGDNNIRSLHENIFAKLTQLRDLAIPNNRFTELSENQFKNNPKLSNIWLHGNEIKFLPPKIFENLTMLSYVDLQNNVCVGGFYFTGAFAEMNNQIAKNCGRH